jgi:hypothetical protein
MVPLSECRMPTLMVSLSAAFTMFRTKPYGATPLARMPASPPLKLCKILLRVVLIDFLL